MVKNIINHRLTGYIKRQKLQDRLCSIFQEEIIVTASTLIMTNPLYTSADSRGTQHYNDLFHFDAPRLVSEVRLNLLFLFRVNCRMR